jgi:uncharacterized membrane protein
MLTVKMDIFMYIIAPFATGIYLNIELLQKLGKKENISHQTHFENLIKEYAENITKTLDKNNHVFIKTAGKIYEEIKPNIFSDEQDYSKGFISIDIENLELPDRLSTGKTKVTFINKHINFFTSGIGIFSLKVGFEFQDNSINTAYLKDIVEKKIEEEIGTKFIKEVKNFNNTLTKLLSSNTDYTIFLSKEKDESYFDNGINISHVDSKFLWIHRIYCFCDNEELFKEAKGKKFNEDINKNLIYLLQQTPEDDTPYLFDKYIFFGLGRSLIVLPSSQKTDEIKKIIDLIEIGQYFCYGLYLLNFFLTKIILKDESIEFSKGIKEKAVKDKIEKYQNIRSSSIKHLDQFHDGMNAILYSDHPLLLSKLEKQWRLEHMERHIIYNIKSIDQNRNYNSEVYLRIKQDRLDKLIAIFTLFSIFVVFGAIVDAYSLTKDVNILGITPLTFLLAASLFSIIVIVIIVFQYHTQFNKLKNKILYRFEKKKYK